MTAYGIAHLDEVTPHAEIITYMELIGATLEPYGGRFLVHGSEHEVMEGSWSGPVVVIGFPGLREARAWWDSPAYRDIAPLRSRNVASDIILVEGVPDGYDAATTAGTMREALAAT